MDFLLLLLEDITFAAIAATGFAILFNVPLRALPVCALCGAIGHGLRFVLMHNGLGIEASSFASATFIGLLGEYLSHKVHTPAPVFTIAGVIPMVPGTFAYKTMLGIMKLTSADPDLGGSLLVTTTAFGIKTGLILAGLATGIAVPTLLFKKLRP